MFERVVAIISDSPIPSVSLIHSKISKKYILLYTKEQEMNANLLQNYCNNNFSEITIEFEPMPSILEASDVVTFAKNFMSNIEGTVGIFLTAGAKQTILPFLIHSPSSPTITLLHTPQRLVIHRDGESPNPVPVTLSLEDILASRGWQLNSGSHGGLKKDNTELTDVAVTFDQHTGRLFFTCESFLRKKGREHEIHDLSKPEKNKIKEQDQQTIGKLLQLSNYFGRNGAVYTIQGELRSPNKSVLPYFIRYEPSLVEDEEE